MRNKFIFDVDGTLTPSRGKMDYNFKAFFNTFCLVNDVYLVTGSDKPKTIEQISEGTYNLCKRVYQCSGSDVWDAETNILKSGWTLSDLARTFLISCEYESPFTERTGNHIEQRSGMVNFSVVGRNADKVQRKDYFYYDIEADERIHIAERINKHFPNVSAVVGGETGIDIIAKGKDKRQVLQEIQKDRVFFFGDRMDPDGNDFSLAYAVKEAGGVAKQVKSWRDTKEIF